MTPTSSLGYSNKAARRKTFHITRDCGNTDACSFAIILKPARESPRRTLLTLIADGWYATFPPRRYVCGYRADGQAIYWPEYRTIVFRFTDGGRSAEANERDLSYAAGCGYGTATSVWTATRR